MKTIDLTPLYRNSIGFDHLAALLDNAFKADTSLDSYPAYDIEAMEENRYTITLAVAGFKRDELSIETEGNVLSIKGNKDKGEKDQRTFVHRGIANKNFERHFNLAEYVEVTHAALDNGLLTIELKQELPESMKPRRIHIETEKPYLEHDAGQDKAA